MDESTRIEKLRESVERLRQLDDQRMQHYIDTRTSVSLHTWVVCLLVAAAVIAVVIVWRHMYVPRVAGMGD